MIVVLALVAAALALGWGASAVFGSAMSPAPPEVLRALARLAGNGDLFIETARTLTRGVAGILVANVAGVVVGVAAGSSGLVVRFARPAITAVNGCPPVVWISLAMVWLGSGGGVPAFAVIAATLPPIFLATVEGTLSVDPRLKAMSRAFAVPRRLRLIRLVAPSAYPFWSAAFAHTSSAAWKVAATAEFLGAADGMGSRIYWAYRRLDMADLYAWTLAVTALGVLIDTGLIARLKRPPRTAAREDAP